MSGWGGFTTAVSGLLTSQKQLYTTNHNIANANTEGYSRQVAEQKAMDAFKLPGVGMLGSGTEVTNVTRVRDSYLNFKYWNENAVYGEWESKREKLSTIEQLFNEPSDSAIRNNMDEMFSAMEALSKNPSSNSARAQFMQDARSFIQNVNELSKKLQNEQKELNFEVKSKIKQVNDYSDQIAELNEQIRLFELDGTSANDLRDRRELLVDKLSKIVNVNVREEGTDYRVSIGGISLVDNRHVTKFKYPPSVVENPQNTDEKLVKVTWSSGEEVNLKGGEIDALLQVRGDGKVDDDGKVSGEGSGINGNYRGIPFYINKLDEFAQKLYEKMNVAHHNGVGLEGSKKIFMFTTDNKSTYEVEINGKAATQLDFTNKDDIAAYKKYISQNVKASNLTISLDLESNLDNIAAAGKDGGKEDNQNMLDIIALREDTSFFDSTTPKGTPDDFMKSILSTLSVDSQQSLRMSTNEKAIVHNIAIRRESDSGVSTDEELSNMVKFSKAYNASARMISTLDKIMDITINGLGMAGR